MITIPIRRYFTALAALLLLLFAPSRALAQTVSNGGFDTPLVNTFQSSPSGSGWNFVTPAGISSGTWYGSGFGVTGTHAGQFAYLQWNGAGGSVSQSITFPSAGTYILSYVVAGRDPLSGGPGDTTYSVVVSGGVLSTSGSTTSGQSFTPASATLNIPAAGNYTLTFANTTGSGDAALYVDSVAISPATGSISATYTSATDVPVTAANAVLSGGTATLALGYAPVPGTNLTVVKNTGLGFISGTFSNLAQGQSVVLSYGGVTYNFVANYYGGSGNDLVLQWANVRPLAWGYNSNGELGNNSTTQSNVPTAVLNSGVLAGKTVVAVSMGSSHCLALCSDGTLAAWGNNYYGQLGNNSMTNSPVPVAVLSSGVLAGKTVVAVAAGQYHSVALCSDGTVAAWGFNGNGQLGNNSTTDSHVPVAVNMSGVIASKTVVAVAAGQYHSVALCSDGTLAAWGDNSYGDLGNNSTIQSNVPVAVDASGVLAGKTVVAVAAGQYHSVALCSDGTLAAWGFNGNGQLGTNSMTNSYVPVAVDTSGVLAGKTVVAVAAGQYHSVALCSDGTLAAWGYNGNGQLGNNSTTQSIVPVAVTTTGVLAGRTVIAVSAGRYYTVALCSDDTVVAWGYNNDGELGNNSTTQSNVPVTVDTSALASGERCSLVGSGPTASNTLALVASPPVISSISATYATATDVPVTSAAPNLSGGTATLALGYAPATGTNLTVVKNTGLGFISGTFSNLAQGQSVVLSYGGVDYNFVANYYGGSGNDLVLQWANVRPLAWGYNGYGELGNNSTTDSPVPVAVDTSGVLSGKTVVSVSVGSSHSVALCSDGTVAAWGNNFYGQLGNNSTTPSNVPVAVTTSGVLAGKTVVAVSAGFYHSMALCSDGTLAAWGDNGYGQVGNNSTTRNLVPVAVDTSGVLAGKTVVSVSAGHFHSMALCSDGTLAAWGSNSSGSLGDNSTTDSPVPVAVLSSGVLSGKTVVAVAAGGYHSMALCSDGTLAAWGGNGYGELGNNSTTDSPVPVAVDTSGVLSGKTVVSVSAGRIHSLALCSDGTVAAWGDNSYGGLGSNSTTQSNVPVAVLSSGGLAGMMVVALAAGNGHSVALCSDGTLAAWGRNDTGQLGNNSTTQSNVPVAVDTSALANGERFSLVGSGPTAQHTLALVASPPVISSISATYATATDVPVTSAAPNLSGGTATLVLGYAPVPGTNLTVVKNTGLGFISGTFSNLAQGQSVVLSYGGVTYNFVANYYGGSGNDLVLQWANVRPLAWGYNSNGQLGNNSTIDSHVPVAVLSSGVLAGKTVIGVAEGSAHTLALCSDGTMAAWGNNDHGQLGNNSTTQSLIPVLVNTSGVLAGKTIVAIAAGFFHSVALCSDGTLAAWGLNAYGLLGNNSTTQSTVPVAVDASGVLAGKTVVAVSAGYQHSVALCSDGTLAAWGYNNSGELGNNSTTQSTVPVAVDASGVLAGKTVVAVAAGQGHSVALCSDGTLAAWGINSQGELGNNSTTYSNVPVAVLSSGVLAGKTVVAVSAGASHCVALCSDGTLAAWGLNSQGELGNNSKTDSPVPVAVDTSGVLAGKAIVAVAAGGSNSVALCSDGTLAAWGLNAQGELGNNSTTQSNVPVAVATSGLASGEHFSLLGGGSMSYHTLALVASPPPLPPTATTGAASSITTTGATLNGTVNASGASTTVTFDYGTTTSYGETATAAESPVSGTSDTAVSAAISSLVPGTTYHFRVTATNALGTTHGSDATFTTPVGSVTAAYASATDVPVTTSAATISSGSTAALSLGYAPVAGTNLTVVKNTGLGFISGTFSNLTQGQVVPLSYGGVTYNFVANYYGGSGNDLMLQWANVRPLAWGNNGNGQLGNNSTTQSNVPVAVLNSGVLAGKTVVSLAVGAYHSLALCSDGTVAAWGFNPYGQLGNDSTTDSAVPVAVNVVSGTSALYGKTVVAVAAGYGHSMALCDDGTVAAWGNNGYGQLGDNSTTTNLVPVAVNVASGTSALYGKTVVSVTAGQYYSVALCSDGTVAAWGSNGFGQLGNNSYTDSAVPVAVNVASGTSALYGKTVVSLVAGDAHSLALCDDGTVAAWGWNGDGQLGNNSTTDSLVPVAVNVVSGMSALSGKTVVSVAGGGLHSLALCSDGTVVVWGANYDGMLGNNSTTYSIVPVAVNVASGTSALYGKAVVSLVAGAAHSLALCDDGTVAAWGYNGNGQLGNNSTTDSHVPVPVNTGALASGERFSFLGSGSSAYHTLALVASLPPPVLAVEQPLGTGLTGGSSTIGFGVMAAGFSTTAKSFTLKNLGGSDLTGIVITTDGTNAGDYTVSTTGMTTTVVPNGSTTFTVTFTPAAATVSGARTATLHIASNDATQNPFDVALSGTGLSQTYDTDSDGLNDAAEFKLASLGFDWQTAQPALVDTLTANANTANLFSQAQVQTQVAASRQSGRDDVTGSPNTYSLYTQSQFQALSVGVPLLQKDGTTGQFKLTIGVQKSTDLTHFNAFPLTAPQTTVNAQGELELQFTVPDGAAFFRLQSQ